jgi:uncharacterized protein (TIGR03437 family)
MRNAKRIGGGMAALVVAVFLAGTPAEANYHYVRFATRNAPFSPIREAFDLNALPNKTLTFLVSDSGPATYAPNDSFGSVLSQVKQAAAAWNSVASSDLRVAFGGLQTYNVAPTASTPGGDVVFQDLPPGLLGMGTPVVSVTASVSSGQNGQFTPIRRGLVILTDNTSEAPGPSYLEGFYTTAVHEFGHALGLQHTWTSSAMSQDIIRNTSRARPLDADDIAAISILYGKAGWSSNYGSISGRVTANGQGVSLASVVAIPPTGPAVSALTNPDGTYTISGLPPNNYLLYAHPLPPDAIATDNTGLVPPSDLNGQQFPPSGPFQTVFYPGTLDPAKAVSFAVTGGMVLTNENFAVQATASVPTYDVITYSFFDTASQTYSYVGPAVNPAFVNSTQSLLTISEVAGNSHSTPVPVSATLLGGFGNAQVQPYGSPQAVALYFNTPLLAGTGPRHLVLNFGNDIYILPDAVTLVQRNPPQVNGVMANGDGSVTILGNNFGSDSKVFFDGLQADAAPSANNSANSLVVIPPPGTSGQVSTVTVFNSDGQNSMLLASAPQTYTYPAAAAPQIGAIAPAAVPAGTSAMIDITGLNTNFENTPQSSVTVGFGTNDVTVTRVWVLSPTHLVANVVVAPGAALGFSEISVVSGFQVIAVPNAFQVQPANPVLPRINLPITNGLPGQQTIYVNGYASIYGQNLSASSNGTQVTLNGITMPVSFTSPTQINFFIPAGFQIGQAVLQLNNGSASAFPVAVEIDNAPPTIVQVANTSGVLLSSTNAASPGDVLNILLSGLDPTVLSNLSRVQVTVSGVSMPVTQILPGPGGLFQVQSVLTQSFGGSQVPLAVAVDGSSSVPFIITAR